MTITAVASFTEPWEAHMLRGRLEVEGIPAYVIHEFHVWNNWPLATALFGVKVVVPSMYRDDANAVWSACREGLFRQMIAGRFAVDDEMRCPQCSSTDYRKHRHPMRAALVIVLSLAGYAIPPVRWYYRCSECNTRWQTE